MLSSALHTTPSEYYTQTQREEIKFLKKKRKTALIEECVGARPKVTKESIQTKILRRLKVAVLRLEMLV